MSSAKKKSKSRPKTKPAAKKASAKTVAAKKAPAKKAPAKKAPAKKVAPKKVAPKKVAKAASAKPAKPVAKPRWLAKPNETIAKQLKKLEAAAKKSELTHRFDQIAALAKPGIDFTVTKAKPADVAGVVSRIGGEPDLPASLPWPRTNAGPLTFIAQVLVDDVKGLDVEGILPKGGLLSFFAQLDLEAPDYGDKCFVAHFPQTGELSRILPPTSAASTADKIGLLTPTQRLTVPPREGSVVEKLAMSAAENKSYHDALYLKTLPAGRCHMLLGWPTAATHHGIRGKRFLAQFDSDEAIGFEMGDFETLRFYIDADSVNAKTLTTAVCTLSEA